MPIIIIVYCVVNKEYVKCTGSVIPKSANITKRDIPYTPIYIRICFDHNYHT